MLLTARLAKCLDMALKQEQLTPAQREEALAVLREYDRHAKQRFAHLADTSRKFDAVQCAGEMPFLGRLHQTEF